METSTHRVSPLRQRMIEDMRLRKLKPKTQTAYIRAVRKLAKYLGRSPDTATEEDLRRFQLHPVDEGVSPITLNATIVGLNFFFSVTLRRPEVMARMQSVRVPPKLPVVLSKEEVARLIGATRNPKHQVALSLAYGTGLRVSEIVAHGTGQRPQGSLRHALAHPAGAPACLVACGARPGQDAGRRLAVSGHGSAGRADRAPAQPRRARRRHHGPDRQARLHGHTAFFGIQRQKTMAI